MEQLGLLDENIECNQEEKPDTKVCKKCNKEKLLSAFSFHSGANYLRNECKGCNNELKKVRDKLRLENPLPGDDYICPICDRDAEEVSGLGGKHNGPWVLDHCHETNTFRGYLCHDCNRKLGGACINPDWFIKARDYYINGGVSK